MFQCYSNLESIFGNKEKITKGSVNFVITLSDLYKLTKKNCKLNTTVQSGKCNRNKAQEKIIVKKYKSSVH